MMFRTPQHWTCHCVQQTDSQKPSRLCVTSLGTPSPKQSTRKKKTENSNRNAGGCNVHDFVCLVKMSQIRSLLQHCSYSSSVHTFYHDGFLFFLRGDILSIASLGQRLTEPCENGPWHLRSLCSLLNLPYRRRGSARI